MYQISLPLTTLFYFSQQPFSLGSEIACVFRAQVTMSLKSQRMRLVGMKRGEARKIFHEGKKWKVKKMRRKMVTKRGQQRSSNSKKRWQRGKSRPYQSEQQCRREEMKFGKSEE